MAWTTNPYCTLADVKSDLDLQSTTDDAYIQDKIVEAQAEIDRYLGYPFQQDGTLVTPASRYYDGKDRARLWIDDCLSVAQVLETQYSSAIGANGVFTLGTAHTTDITADCFLYPYNDQPAYFLRRVSGLPFERGTKNYQVFGIFGQPSIPTPIGRATKLLTIHYLKRRDATYGNATANKKVANPLTFTATGIPCEVTDILDRYRERLFLSE